MKCIKSNVESLGPVSSTMIRAKRDSSNSLFKTVPTKYVSFLETIFSPVCSSDPFSAFYQRPIWPFSFGKNLAAARFFSRTTLVVISSTNFGRYDVELKLFSHKSSNWGNG